MSGYCVTGDHANCPDSTNDTGGCTCPCHLIGDAVDVALDSGGNMSGITADDGSKWIVQTGKGKGKYDKTYEFDRFSQAVFHYGCLNTHSGYKKRLIQVKPDGSKIVTHRLLT